MCHIYYPYFKIEKSTQNKKYNHKLYILLLSLFCDKILIPSRHLLEIENDKFDILLNCKTLFQKNIIYSRIPKNQNCLMDYYNSIKTSITNRPQEIVELRIQKIVNDLYSNKDTCETYEPLEQQEYYFQTMKIFLQEYKKNHKNVKGMGNIDSFWNITDIITKEDFDPFLKDLKKQEHITKSTYARIKKASDLLYFVAGASTERIKVCYDTYFEHKCIRPEIEIAISTFDEIINKKYNPDEIIQFLIRLKVIEQESDLQKLDISDVIYLRNLKCFNKFINEFEKYSTRSDSNDYFEKKRSTVKAIRIIKSAIVSVVLTCASTVIGGLITSSLIWSIIIALISLVLYSLITYMWQKKNKYKIPVIEGILDEIIGFFDPVSLYLAKIKWRLDSE